MPLIDMYDLPDILFIFFLSDSNIFWRRLTQMFKLF